MVDTAASAQCEATTDTDPPISNKSAPSKSVTEGTPGVVVLQPSQKPNQMETPEQVRLGTTVGDKKS